MSKKVIIISSSPRLKGNSSRLADEFMKGAQEAGHEVEKISLAEKTINFCNGCLACQKTQRCVIHDDADTIAQKMLTADVLVFATPVYYYSISGQLKTMLDRANPLYSADYAFRDVYLLATAAEDEDYTASGAVAAIQGWTECFSKVEFKAVLFAGGVTNINDIDGHMMLAKAYQAGRNV